MADPSSVTYCTAADVQRALLLPNAFNLETVTPTSNPTTQQVADFILEAEDEINNLTKHSWKTITVTEEYYDFPSDAMRFPYGHHNFHHDPGVAVFMRHREIKDFDNEASDKIEVWNGNEYQDWVTAKTEGRESDWWLDNTKGILYLKTAFRYHRKQALRLTYRYGKSTVDKDIQKATALMVAIRILAMDDRSVQIDETGDPTRQSYTERINKMEKELSRIIENREEYTVI